MAVTTYLEAIRQGLWEEMERDPSVFCLGEDIGIYGGAFKVTDGFIHHFGPERVIDTPIAESAIVGAAFGASLTGMRPVAEFQFMDFIGCAFNQIVNMVAKAHYRWGAPAPVVIRGPSGGNVHGGPFHSQNPEMWFVHAPGLDRQHGSQGSLSLGGTGAGGDPRPQWRQRARRSLPFAESGDVVRPRPGFESCVPGRRLRCKGSHQGSDPRQQSSDFFRA